VGGEDGRVRDGGESQDISRTLFTLFLSYAFVQGSHTPSFAHSTPEDFSFLLSVCKRGGTARPLGLCFSCNSLCPGRPGTIAGRVT